MNTHVMSGSEMILQVGRKLYPHMGFNLDTPETRQMYEKMFYILTENHDKLSLHNLKPRKGILLQGNIGVGKSIMMRVMQTLFRDSPRAFKWINCIEFNDMLQGGVDPSEIKERYGRKLMHDLYIDDLGMGGGDMKRFGNVTNIVAEILFERDELLLSHGILTHCSSNTPKIVPADSPPELKSLERMYGDRILDRMKQMMNNIIWTGKSLRG